MTAPDQPPSANLPLRQVRARHDATTITVYQAYSPSIAEPAAAAGRFVPPFSRTRMTWIKPSFLWMMYRAGWAAKPGQERILAIDITREGFDHALSVAALSHFEGATHASPEAWAAQVAASPVRVQWDPERDFALAPMPWRAIQVGLGPEVVPDYVNAWTQRITDVTDLARDIKASVDAGDLSRAREMLPAETAYPLAPATARRLGAKPA